MQSWDFETSPAPRRRIPGLPGMRWRLGKSRGEARAAALPLPILRPGRNVWKTAPCQRAAVLVDAGTYFAALERACLKARRSIVILGWDFDGSIRLHPKGERRLGEFLRRLVENNPELEIRILVWSLSVVHAPSATLPALIGADWLEHPRIHMHLDTVHPLYGAHHQKIVCIDDRIAFVGGMDLTVQRWDTNDHTADDPLRHDEFHGLYPAVHDVQMLVDGEAAAAVAALARERWLVGVGQELSPVACADDPWPADVPPDFTDVAVGIARTIPAWNGYPGAEEIAALTVDALRAARRSIYIEAQYFAAPSVGKVLAESLSRPEGPEIVAVSTERSRGFLEQWAMGSNRDRLIRRLRKADRYGRFRIYYPVVPSDKGDCAILVHSKTIIVDDRLMRIGSANLNNRSLGLDTECDLVIEGSTPAVCETITTIRTRLLAEHLGTTPEKVTEALAEEGSLIAAVDKLNCQGRCLRPFEIRRRGPTGPVFGTFLLDPRRPFGPSWFHRWKRYRKKLVGSLSFG